MKKLIQNLSFCLFLMVLITTGNAYALIPTQVETDRLDSDERHFKQALAQFKQAILKKDSQRLSGMLHYPFFTSNVDAGSVKGTPSDPLSKTEFATYEQAIFNADVTRYFPRYLAEELSEINHKSDSYYQTLIKITDQNSKLYEVYFQFPETKTKAESYFGFVFGRVNGQYKALSYYAKWPVK